MRSDLEQLASDLGLRHTTFIGRVPFEAMPDLYDAADIYLNANDIDNTPGSILECFAAGLLVVTTKAGGIPYILEHERTGLMVKCGDHEALAASAIRLLGDPVLAARLALNARESVTFLHASRRVQRVALALPQNNSPEDHPSGPGFREEL